MRARVVVLLALYGVATIAGSDIIAGGPVGRYTRERYGPVQQAASAAHLGIDPPGMDRSVAPGDDFFRFANGQWLKTTEIPPDRSSYGVFAVLAEATATRTRDLLEKAAAGQAAPGSEERKVGDY